MNEFILEGQNSIMKLTFLLKSCQNIMFTFYCIRKIFGNLQNDAVVPSSKAVKPLLGVELLLQHMVMCPARGGGRRTPSVSPMEKKLWSHGTK